MQKRRYTRLADQERESISRGLAQHKSFRQLARELNRSPSTISREIRRNKVTETRFLLFLTNGFIIKLESFSKINERGLHG